MLDRAHALWKSIRKTVCPKRIYQYGTVALNIFDDRTPLEMVCDYIDGWFFDRVQAQRYAKSDASRSRCLEWVDKLGNSSQKIREHEKKGYAYASAREWEQTANNAKKRLESESNARIRERVQYAYSEVKKGRSYIKEQREAIEKAKRNA
jgi:hypothetical protein